MIFDKTETHESIETKPLKLKDLKLYESLYNTFALSKKHIPDKDIIKMSYLKYALYVYEPSYNNNYAEKIDMRDLMSRILYKVLYFEGKEIKKINIDISFNSMSDMHIKTYQDLNIKTKSFVEILLEDGSTIKLNDTEFEKLRKQILEQNGISFDYIEQYDPKLEEKMAIYLKKNKSATLEEQIFSFCAMMKKLPEEVENVSFYDFRKLYSRLSILSDYETYKGLESSGQVKFKKKEIPHWSSHVEERGRYDEILISKESFEQNDFQNALKR